MPPNSITLPIKNKKPITKTEIEETVSNFKTAFESGEIDILEGIVQLKAINETSGKLLKELAEKGIAEKMKYPEKEASILSVGVTLVEPSKP